MQAADIEPDEEMSMTTATQEGTTQERQAELVDTGLRAPGISEMIAVYAALKPFAPAPPPVVVARPVYANGGNAA